MADDLIDVEDDAGNRYRISAAHRNRYPSVAETFRLVPEKATPVVVEVATVTVKPPKADKNKEK